MMNIKTYSAFHAIIFPFTNRKEQFLVRFKWLFPIHLLFLHILVVCGKISLAGDGFVSVSILLISFIRLFRFDFHHLLLYFIIVLIIKI